VPAAAPKSKVQSAAKMHQNKINLILSQKATSKIEAQTELAQLLDVDKAKQI